MFPLDVVPHKADTLAPAICKAEGGDIVGTLPYRCHNPGDMKLGDRGWGTENGKTIYQKADFGADLQDKTDGASALRRECLAILSGASHIYSPSWTFIQLATQWTGGDNPEAWCRIVCEQLGVTPSTTLRQYVLQSEPEDI